MSGHLETGPVWPLPDEAATAALASRVAARLDDGLVFYLHGPLGAGKTSFARALLTALGVGERVKSPTYSLMEGYTARERPAWHLDLYRIADPGELEWLGLDTLTDPDALVLVEWPERGAGALPAADLELRLDYLGEGRRAQLRAFTARGVRLLRQLS
ncbi:MAG: tRNA (adenosine(37)-N6)-threonylcarbamoyltransferase complex ATPase subunit type 1 TsaE [Rhodanobacter sp.]|nr:MAG: tRNA (adenosine(37)-N6)-threonylcarbamoyltransferase complex ATPase subunit type 1 TsaE [Rhodanobacter sp.]TAL96650.1 MAG: tRNA (adenosine(37)-N6)-threonylcarbamoyltransferase complex ATPase subunit type 1 TsaE [Rhodanobacter sp.]TAM42990.1 MAG: tRNA (adenosine(37)-N6)-threonylcarbamoyltransferase complex ATPase subunit type 1 TsaE [Rhodanobacter sp.]TAN28147.1 MAG: tRNA (adenosine(37)-N6)-threonylcarbamoyltransferase complex ATPase subunit type 1 TsaE [Rhodanobacter sp.]